MQLQAIHSIAAYASFSRAPSVELGHLIKRLDALVRGTLRLASPTLTCTNP